MVEEEGMGVEEEGTVAALVVVAQAIGSSLLFGDSDSGFFAGLLDELATWWDSLGPTGQLLVTALGVMLLMSAGSTFALAMGAVGVLTWAAAHGHGLLAGGQGLGAKGTAQMFRELLVDRLTDDAANVIGLEDGCCHVHDESSGLGCSCGGSSF